MERKLTFFFCLFMSAYFSKGTSFSPVYLVYLVCSMIFVLMSCVRMNSFKYDSIVALTLFIYALTRFSFNGSSFNLVLGLAGYMALRSFRAKFNLSDWKKYFRITFKVSLFAVALDSVYRLMNPTHPNAEQMIRLKGTSSEFYLYKFNSLMFADSNTSALILIIIYFSLVHTGIRLFKFDRIFIFILLLLTFSRAAYISLVFGMGYRWIGKNRLRLILAFSLLPLVLLYLISSHVISDGSLLSKIYIWRSVITALSSMNMSTYIFGLGMGHGEELLHIFPHILVLTYMLDLGLIGLFIFLVLVRYWWVNMQQVVLPIVLISFSYFLYLGAPFLFVPMAVLLNIKDSDDGK